MSVYITEMYCEVCGCDIKQFVGVKLESIGLHVDMLWLRKCRENNTGSEEQFKDGYSICDVYLSSISAEGGEKSR